MLKPVAERRVFKPIQRGPVDVNVSEKHDWSLLLHKATRNNVENISKNSFSLVSRMAPMPR